MDEILRNIDIGKWMTIFISFITLIYTIMHNLKSDKRLKQVEEINEENRQENILIQKLLSKRNIQVSIIPYFNVVLKDNRIKKKENSLILEIGFINIGKESATNIQLSPKFPDKGLQGYFDSEGYPKKQYYIYEYLSQYYAAAREEVTFKIKVDLKNGEKINDFLKFKIKYYDLIGNEYEQEFRFGFYMLDCIAYNLDNSSYKPILLQSEMFEGNKK